jgi:integrase
MARSLRDAKLDTRTSRLKLNTETYYTATIGEGLGLRYRRPKSGNGTWQARVRIDRKYIHHVVGEADDYMDADGTKVFSFYQAQEKTRQYSEEARRPNKLSSKPVTVSEASTHYMDWYRENRKAVVDTERTINAHILPTFGTKLVMDLTSLEIKRWHEKLASSPPRRRTRAGSKQNYGEKATTTEAKRSRKSTANRVLTVLKAILNKAFEDGLVPDDKEWRKVKPFKQVDEPIVRFLTVAESTRLINSCKEDFRMLVQAALLTGCRYGELSRILVTHVNLDTGLVYINPETKSGKGRHVPLNAEGLRFFQQQIAGKNGLEYVFTREDESPWLKNHQSRLMKAACEQARINPPIGFHELRHTYASLLAQAGADLLTISKLLGHADTRITSRHYAHLCDKTLTNAVKTLLPVFGASLPSKIVPIR